MLAPLGSLLVSARRGELCRVRYRDGVWIHRYRDGAVAQPWLGGPSARLQDEAALDYFLFDYPLKPGDTVFDLGAGVGGEVRLFSHRVGPAGRVVSVEAHPRTFRCLAHTVGSNGLDNVIALQLAVTGGEETVYIEDDPLAHVSNRLTDATHGIAVPGCTLGDLMARVGADRISLLKMNIEGAELPVLEAAADRLAAVDHIVVACHDFKSEHPGDRRQRTRAPVVELLSAAGFKIRTRPGDPRPWIAHYVYGSR
jgi:FkbM family methyltransferase